MAPIRKRLPLRQYSGPKLSIEISEEQFEHDLEPVYGIKFSPEDRAEIADRCNTYLNWRRFELTQESYSDVQRLFAEVKKAVRCFRRFAGGHLFDHSDASATLRWILGMQYRRSPVQVKGNLSVVQLGGSREPADVPPNIVLELNDVTLAAAAGSLVYALLKAEQVIQDYEQGDQRGFAPGEAFRNFLLSMRSWAKERSYPISPYKNTGKSGAYNERAKTASPFARFLFELNQLFKKTTVEGREVNLADPVNSAEALAERLKDVAAVANRLKRPREGR
jgi:hypothetical protein